MKIRIRLALVFLALHVATLSASAQYPPYPYPYPYGGGAGGALSGSANVMSSYGDVINAQEQARITREKANQAKLDTKKQAFDLMLYEKANTPSYTETLTKEKGQILTRAMNFPTKSEIADGSSLNVMLPFLQSLSNGGVQGPPVPIPQSMVNLLNISSSGNSSVGMLRDGGKVDWPIGLQGKNQQALDKLLPQAYDGVARGTLKPQVMKSVHSEMADMRQTLRTQLQKEEIDGSTYMQALQFYNALDSSITALERPDARKQIGGSYSPRARNVQELIDFMTDNGVRFAPASPGNENAYQVVHDAFVRYARAGQSSAGFTAQK